MRAMHQMPPIKIFGVFHGVIALQDERLDFQIGKSRDVDILVFIQHGADLVDDGVFPALADERFHLFAFFRADIVFRENFADFFHALGDGRFIVGRAIHAEQIFQHEGRHVRAAAKQRRQILSDDLSRKHLVDLSIQCVHVPASLKKSKSMPNTMSMVNGTRASSVRSSSSVSTRS